MTEYLKSGKSDEWYTPPWIFDALGFEFDLDPCAPSHDHWTPAYKKITKEEDGLTQPWEGVVFMNPPFGGRNGIIPWLEKFVKHGGGIGIAPARTSCGWFQEYMPQMDALVFPKGKTKFIPSTEARSSSPMAGVVLFSIGVVATERLKKSGIGFYLEVKTA